MSAEHPTTVLVVAEARRGQLREISLELVSAARELTANDGNLAIAVIDAQPESFVDQLSIGGVDELLMVRAPTENFEPHIWRRALIELIDSERPDLVLMGHTIDSLGVAGAVAAQRGLGLASDVTAVSRSNELRVQRGAYGEKVQVELEFPRKECVLLTIRPGTFEAATPQPDHVGVRTLTLALDDAARTEHLEYREVNDGDVDITVAPFLLSIGRGVGDEDNIPRFERLADQLGATLSVSRPLVDAGWISNARQVGQSGKTVRPRVYLALGISGAVQHLAGMRGAETIIAVNSDAEAPIFRIAHYGAVGDLFEIADALERQIN